MKVVMFTDVHAEISFLEEVKEKAKDADFAICLGDISWFEEGIELMLELINALPKHVLMLHGNHERITTMRELTKEHANINFSHKELVQIGDFDFITYGGDGFSRIDPEFEEFIKQIKSQIRDPKKTILLLHGPPFNTVLDIPFDDYHSGSHSFRNFIEEFQPLASFSGHVHEGEKLTDKIGNTFLMNPGPDGEVVDLMELYNKRKD